MPKPRSLATVVPGEEPGANTGSELDPSQTTTEVESEVQPNGDDNSLQSQLETLAAAQQALIEGRTALAAEREQFERDKLAMQRSGPNEQSSLRPSPALVNASKQAQSAKANAADWSQRPSAEAAAAGVTKPVLCKDGHFVPAEFGSKA